MTKSKQQGLPDDLPGSLAHALAIAKQEWPATIDAEVWADKWLEIIAENPGVPRDRQTMIAWFAGAIMAGFDTARYRARNGDA